MARGVHHSSSRTPRLGVHMARSMARGVHHGPKVDTEYTTIAAKQ